MQPIVDEVARGGRRYLPDNKQALGQETLPGTFFHDNSVAILMNLHTERNKQSGEQPAYLMNQLQKQIYLLPVLLLNLALCTLTMQLLKMIVEQWQLDDTINIYIYMAGSCFIMYYFLIPRLRLIIHLNGFLRDNESNMPPTLLMMAATLLLVALYFLMPYGILHFTDRLGRIEIVSKLEALEKPLDARYVGLTDSVILQLLPSKAQPVRHIDQAGKTYRYEYYSVFVPKDSSRQYKWMPCYRMSLGSVPENDQQWADSLVNIYTQALTGVVHYFRHLRYEGRHTYYYEKSMDLPSGQNPEFYEKIAVSPEVENEEAKRNLTLISLGNLLFFTLLIFIMPVNQLYAPLFLEAGIPWWNPLLDRKLLPFMKKY